MPRVFSPPISAPAVSRASTFPPCSRRATSSRRRRPRRASASCHRTAFCSTPCTTEPSTAASSHSTTAIASWSPRACRLRLRREEDRPAGRRRVDLAEPRLHPLPQRLRLRTVRVKVTNIRTKIKHIKIILSFFGFHFNEIKMLRGGSDASIASQDVM